MVNLRKSRLLKIILHFTPLSICELLTCAADLSRLSVKSGKAV